MDDRNILMLEHEAQLARNERTIRRLIIVLLIVTALMFISNMVWLHCWMQYDYVSEEVSYTQMGEGINNINSQIGGDAINESTVNH